MSMNLREWYPQRVSLENDSCDDADDQKMHSGHGILAHRTFFKPAKDGE